MVKATGVGDALSVDVGAFQQVLTWSSEITIIRKCLELDLWLRAVTKTPYSGAQHEADSRAQKTLSFSKETICNTGHCYRRAVRDGAVSL